MEELTKDETEGQDKLKSRQEIRGAEVDDKTRADPAQPFPRDHRSHTRVVTTIYMETVKFLLQSCALQVIQIHTAKYNTPWDRIIFYFTVTNFCVYYL